jgi:hypothetical protein
MPFTNAGKNLMLDALAAEIDEMSLHTDEPDASGSDEATGGSYAREVPTIAASVDGEIFLDDDVVFDVPAGTFTHVGFWADSVFVGYDDLAEPQVYASAGTLTLNTSTVLRITDPA